MEQILCKAFDRPLAPGTLIYNLVSQFLTREAWLLDHNRLHDWTKLLASDVTYTMPLRVTQSKTFGIDQVSRENFHYLDDYQSLCTRVSRVADTRSAWSDDPAPRIRRMITNIAVGETDKPDEFEVMSYLLLARNRFEAEDYTFITAERHDLLRRNDESFTIARREIFIDLSVLGVPNLAFFL